MSKIQGVKQLSIMKKVRQAIDQANIKHSEQIVNQQNKVDVIKYDINSKYLFVPTGKPVFECSTIRVETKSTEKYRQWEAELKTQDSGVWVGPVFECIFEWLQLVHNGQPVPNPPISQITERAIPGFLLSIAIMHENGIDC